MRRAAEVTHKTYRESLQNNQDIIRQSIELGDGSQLRAGRTRFGRGQTPRADSSACLPGFSLTGLCL